ncbi:MAG TPA: substrate-binding domain-containing protein [Spirochaetia bacterium]|nr:substrate-binding domain-containing protein [Spirochaetia bacterium]
MADARRTRTSTPRRRVIGVFMAQLADAYQSAVWEGIERQAQKRHLGVVGFIGSRLESPVGSEKKANIAYGLADPKAIDGLVTVSSAIATFLEARGIERLFASRGSLPQVSVGLRVRGISSITVDGSGSVSELIRHIAEHHRRRRFALIGGPPGHAEAEDRVRAFRQTLADMGVTFDERLEAEGSFLRNSGAEAMRAIISRGIPFNALFCANDRMALGAVEVLREHGLRVPRDVAVAGFDGIEEGRYLTPPLTTVIQPLGELGSRAVDLLVDRMNGGAPVEQVLTCTPIIRRSCGCVPRRAAEGDLAAIRAGASVAKRRAVDRLAALARAGDEEGFTACLDAALASSADPDLLPWIDLLAVARRKAFSSGRRLGPAAAGLFELAAGMVGETASRVQAARRVAQERRMAALRDISAYLGGAFELPLMLRRLEEGLSSLGIERGYVALFDGDDAETGWARLVLATRPGRRSGVARSPRRFRVERLLPAGEGTAWRSGHWILEPLVYQDEALGYFLFSAGIGEPAVYDTLREQLSSALKGALLMEQVRTHERRLEAEVARRTAELTRANRELTREVARRQILEREVLEVSNRTMQRIGQDLHDDLSQHLAGIAMFVSVLRAGIVATDPDAAEPLSRINTLLGESIVRAKQIARGLYPAGLAEHGLAAAIEELVSTARQSSSAEVQFRSHPGFALADSERAAHVYRIVQEALSNALKHSGARRVEVALSREERDGLAELVAEVTDNGVGVAPSGGAPVAGAVPGAGDGAEPGTAASGSGMGLRIMRYRAETAGARLSIERLRPGTRVRLRIPTEGGPGMRAGRRGTAATSGRGGRQR